MEPWFQPKHLADAFVYAVLGIVVLFGGFWIFDRLTPYSLWKELVEKHNTALAIVIASMTLGISIIIAAAITG